MQHSPLLSASLFRIHSPAISSYPSNHRTAVRRAPAIPLQCSGATDPDSVSGRHTWPQVTWQCSLPQCLTLVQCLKPEQAALGGGQCGTGTQKWDQQLLPVVQLLHSPRREFLRDLSGLLCFQLIFICLFWVLLSQTRTLNSTG